jgi:hypothetical protein
MLPGCPVIVVFVDQWVTGLVCLYKSSPHACLQGQTPECAGKKDLLASEGVFFRESRLETPDALLLADDLEKLMRATNT